MNKKIPDFDSTSKSQTTRFFFDSSSIFALIDCGYFHRFCDLLPNFYITTQIFTEITEKDILAKKIISESVSSGKVKVIEPKSVELEKWEDYRRLGLHTGEISILLAAHKKEDVVVFDDFVARSVAHAEGFTLTGLLGLLITFKKSAEMSKKEALSFLSALNQTNFRMSSVLYESILRKLSEE